GYGVLPWFDSSGDYETPLVGPGELGAVSSDHGDGTLSVFLPSSKRAYRPCFTAEVQTLSGSGRSAPACLPESDFTVDVKESGCAVRGAHGHGSRAGALSIVVAWMIHALRMVRSRQRSRACLKR
ncbi:MAG TPA: hypothetical protein VK524_28605, partial [Polyangiaceae bacterium]|nr:hypothetical protein [Polyangiaceae bacterium]